MVLLTLHRRIEDVTAMSDSIKRKTDNPRGRTISSTT